jgi:pimeloyl-ACP methyl ester carboxylesterase
MDDAIPMLLIPGLAGSPRIYAPVLPAIWGFGPVMVASHIRDDNMGAIARRILAQAPPRFALAGHSMGGYIAFEMMRQAPERIMKLALSNAQARPDTPEATARRRGQIARAQTGEYQAVLDELFPGSCIRHDAMMLRCASWFTRWATISVRTRSCGSRTPSSAAPTRGQHWRASPVRRWC